MTGDLRLAAVDLGASSGRVMLGRVGPGRLELTESHRFWNGPVRLRDTLHWDVLALYREMLVGLSRSGPVDGIGIDSWAVDYGLLDRTGALLGNPVHYRDGRTDGVMERVLRTVSADDLYAVTGLQQLPFNTIYQLVATSPDQLAQADKLLLIPDLLAYWLTGSVGAETTNASTTQLYDVRARRWCKSLADRVGVPVGLLPELREAGEVIGPLLPAVAEETGLDPATPVVAVGSHDTASSVVAVPAVDRFAYISSGTWSLVGLELDEPVLSADAQAANFTNEGGVDGRTRFLRNVMGLWLLQESMRTWGADDLRGLLRDAAAEPAFGALVDPDDPSFLAPGNMPARISAACRRTGQQPPETPATTVRCILESLALAYRRTVRVARTVAGQDVDAVHVIGGGSQNELLCQLTADACGLPVLAGPVEASALGNVLVQARALGAPLPDLTAMRALVRATHQLRRYEPRGKPADWDAAEARVFVNEVIG
ncbi:MAG TPA: rhamnulokinase family protein [Kribbella sp.]|nr:rhamnulokinase family protein [Kribbella sp.]